MQLRKEITAVNMYAWNSFCGVFPLVYYIVSLFFLHYLYCLEFWFDLYSWNQLKWTVWILFPCLWQTIRQQNNRSHSHLLAETQKVHIKIVYWDLQMNGNFLYLRCQYTQAYMLFFFQVCKWMKCFYNYICAPNRFSRNILSIYKGFHNRSVLILIIKKCDNLFRSIID